MGKSEEEGNASMKQNAFRLSGNILRKSYAFLDITDQLIRF